MVVMVMVFIWPINIIKLTFLSMIIVIMFQEIHVTNHLGRESTRVELVSDPFEYDFHDAMESTDTSENIQNCNGADMVLINISGQIKVCRFVNLIPLIIKCLSIISTDTSERIRCWSKPFVPNHVGNIWISESFQEEDKSIVCDQQPVNLNKVDFLVVLIFDDLKLRMESISAIYWIESWFMLPCIIIKVLHH